jgi:uncharacterized membrane protein YgaE (UPF0421/DUF939 family)
VSILTILIGVVLAIVILWAVNAYFPPIRLILNIVHRRAFSGAAVCLWVVRSNLSTDRSAAVRSSRFEANPLSS